MAYPKQIHVWIQQRLARLMDRRAEPHGVAGMAIPFRPLAEYADYKIDVAFVSSAQTESGLTLQGSPGIIIEVFSPSNTASEMHDRRQLFFETGCLEFWGGRFQPPPNRGLHARRHHHDVASGPIDTAAPILVAARCR